MTDPIITFEHNGFPIELVSSRDIEKAIASGRLRADTVVTVHGSDGTMVTRRAESVDLLREHLCLREPEIQPDAGPEPECELELSPEPEDAPAPAATEEPPIEAEDVQPPAMWTEALAPTDSPPPLADRPVPPAKRLGWVIASIAVLVLVIGLIASEGNRPPAYVDPGANTVATDAPPVDPGPAVRVTGNAQTYYAARPVKVRAHATGDSTEIATLGRGDAVFGVIVARQSDNEEWVRVESGALNGNFVWRRNLIDEPPPSLSRTITEDRVISLAATLYARPDESAVALQTLDPGSSVHLAGELSSGWWEVELSNGGVGYLRPNAFEAQARFVRIQNSCPYQIDLLLTYQSRNGPEDMGGAFVSIYSERTHTVQYQGINIEAVADNFYYRLTDRTGNPRGALQRANTYIDGDGYYVIPFTCDD